MNKRKFTRICVIIAALLALYSVCTVVTFLIKELLTIITVHELITIIGAACFIVLATLLIKD